MELIRNIVVLGGSDRETYHNAQQEMGSEPPGKQEDESAPYTHTDSVFRVHPTQQLPKAPRCTVRRMCTGHGKACKYTQCADISTQLEATPKIKTLLEHNTSICFEFGSRDWRPGALNDL